MKKIKIEYVFYALGAITGFLIVELIKLLHKIIF